MPETFAQYSEKCVKKQSMAQGLNNLFVKNRWKYAFNLIAYLLFASALLTSCAIPITYHDATTYKNLADLKAEVIMLVETFDAKPFAAVKLVKIDLVKITNASRRTKKMRQYTDLKIVHIKTS
jgi:hypothetical protein